MQDSNEEAPEPARSIDLARLHGRDPELLRELIREVTPSIRAAVRSYATDDDLDDLVQECWIRIMDKLDRFRRDGSFRAWAVVVSRNYCRQQWKQRKRAIETVPLDRDAPSTEPNPEEALHQDQVRTALHEALGRLSQRERDAVVMKLVDGRSTSYIASELGVGESVARKIVHRASYKLQEEDALRDLWLP